MKKLWGAAIAAGALLGISQPVVISALSERPLDESGLSALLVLVGLIPIFWAFDKVKAKGAFGLGFLMCFVQYAIIWYWIFITVHVFGSVPFWPSLGIMFMLAAFMALYNGLAFWVAKKICEWNSWPSLYVLPACYCAMELLRNYFIYGGYPWGAVGYSFVEIPVLLQSASLVGVYGLVFYIAWANGSLFYYFAKERKPFVRLNTWAFATVTCFMLIFGFCKLQYPMEAREHIKISALQGNIEQGIKNQATLYRGEILKRFLSLQKKAVDAGAEIIIWPEASFPGWITKAKTSGFELGEKGPAQILGSITYTPGDNDSVSNSGLILNEDLELLGRFDKSRLVPFGEYVPYPFGPIVSRVIPGMGSFARGGAYRPVALTLANGKTANIGVTICFEGIFPEISAEFAAHGADLMVNLTNDAWYGVSSAPYQHLNMYRMRSVETGKAYVRATNTGVSAVIDADGSVLAATKLYEQTLLTYDVPLYAGTTLYAKVGDVVPSLALLFSLLAFGFGLLNRKRHGRRKS